MRTLVGGLAIVAVLLLGGCSSAQSVGAGTAAPTDEATPSASTTPTAPATPTATPSEAPEPVRPVSLVGIGCDELVPMVELENVVGHGIALGDPTGEQAMGWSATRASFEYAGGLYCRWIDSNGQYRAMASVTPNARAAGEQIAAEIQGDPAKTNELSSGCSADGCRARGFVGDVFLVIDAVPEQPGSAAETAMAGVREAAAGALGAVAPGAELPPLSTSWGDGPDSCAEMLPPEELAAAAGLDSGLSYGPGYAYEASNGSDHALLTAGGFACRYWPIDGYNGIIRVLPDATPALQQAQALAPDTASLVIDGVPDGPASVECSSNGEPAWSAGSTGVCTVHVPARGAWVTVSASGTGDVQAAITERARLLTTAVVAGLG